MWFKLTADRQYTDYKSDFLNTAPCCHFWGLNSETPSLNPQSVLFILNSVFTFWIKSVVIRLFRPLFFIVFFLFLPYDFYPLIKINVHEIK